MDEFDHQFDFQSDHESEEIEVVAKAQNTAHQWVSTSNKVLDCFEELRRYIKDYDLPILNDRYAFSIFYSIINPDRYLKDLD